jgi:hypothetical protein
MGRKWHVQRSKFGWAPEQDSNPRLVQAERWAALVPFEGEAANSFPQTDGEVQDGFEPLHCDGQVIAALLVEKHFRVAENTPERIPSRQHRGRANQ